MRFYSTRSFVYVDQPGLHHLDRCGTFAVLEPGLPRPPRRCIILQVRMYRRCEVANIATTKMSSKGQVVIPEEIRKRLKLKKGSQFVVVSENDVVILKAISPPSMDEFDALIADARKKAKEVGMKRSDIEAAIMDVRGHK